MIHGNSESPLRPRFRTAANAALRDIARRFRGLRSLVVVLSALASAEIPAGAPMLDRGPMIFTDRESVFPPILGLRVSFDDGTPADSIHRILFLRESDTENFLGDAVLCNPSFAIVSRLSTETRWARVCAGTWSSEYRPPDEIPPDYSTMSRMARYDCILPFDASEITTNTKRTLILPRGNASLRVRLHPPGDGDGDNKGKLGASLETVWQKRQSSMIMPGRRQEDGAFLFAPVWPGVYYVYYRCGYATVRRPVAIQDGEHRDEGEWRWPDGRIRGRLLDADGVPRPNETLHFILLETDGFDLSTLGSIPLDAGTAKTDGEGRFECGSLLPGVYLPAIASVDRWDQDGGPDQWPFTTRERVTLESDPGEVEVQLHLKPDAPPPPPAPTPAPSPAPPASSNSGVYTYDPTNGTAGGGFFSRVRQ